MDTLGFGQKVGEVMQMAFVVKNIQDAMHWWMHNCRVGPWFLLDSFTGPEQRYRGKPTKADIKLAMSFSGHMNIELIQPKDKHDSVYKETIDRRGYGFHHLGISSLDVPRERASYEKRGYSVAFETPVPSGGSVYYLNDETREPGFIELIPATTGMDEMFTRFWKATVNWDGDEPIRPFG